MPNRLVEEKSPYLLQHARNPVDWYPWGEPALTRAREEDKPILLSIGYSACHWCHVMERESFEDHAIAALMNDAFVNVKVDREERPDLDGIYMGAVQALTGRGGWPLTVFLTPEGKAFFGGTYFPPGPRHGLPSFRQVLEAVRDAFRNRREEVEKAADQILAALVHGTSPPSSPGPGPEQPPGVPRGEEDFLRALDRAYQVLRSRYDPVHGGFGPAPKFPQPTTLEFLLCYHRRSEEPEALEMVLHTLRQMARGGMRDHLGGGFHRYSVDARWLVPHFEKMLYDNGLLALVYLHAYRITQDPELLGVATSTLDYVLEDLTGPEGGFYSARDADSEGEEGRFYTWSSKDVDRVLGPDLGPVFRRAYGVSEGGNFEGANILNLLDNPPAEEEAEGMDEGELEEKLAGARSRLREHRSLRVPPLRDEKVLTAWNSFVLRAMAEAGAVLGRADYLRAAEKNADFLLRSLREDGRLLRSWKDGPGRIPGFLEDYAGLGNALLTLYEVTLDPRWLREARGLLETTLDLFQGEDGAFYDAPRDGERLIMRPRDVLDNATPSGNSLAVELLYRGGRIFGEARYSALADRVLRSELAAVERLPSAFGRFLSTLAATLSAPVEVVVLGPPGHPDVRAMIREAHRPFIPERLVLGGDPESLPPLPLLDGKSMMGGAPTAYLCRRFACGPPLLDPEALTRELGAEGWP